MLTDEDMQDLAEHIVFAEVLTLQEAEQHEFEVSVIQAEIEKREAEVCRNCNGSGEVGTGERERDTGAYVTRPCRECNATGVRGYF